MTIAYRINPASAAAFARAMTVLRRIRLRDGAIRWNLWCDPAQPSSYLESFVVPSWIEHMRQHERMTKADREMQEAATAHHLGPPPPVVTHYIHAAMGDGGR